MKKILSFVLSIAFFLCCAGISFILLRYIFPVRTKLYTVNPLTITETLSATGKLVPAVLTEVPMDKENNRIIGVFVGEGDKVHKGDPLFLVESGENEEFEYLMGKLYEIRNGYTDNAATRMPTFNYVEENNNVRQKEQELEALEGAVQAAETAINNAKDENGTAPQYLIDNYNNAYNEYIQTRDIVDSMKADISGQKAQDESLLSEVVGTLEYLNNQSNDIQEALKANRIQNENIIYAPCSGTIYRIYTSAGDRRILGESLCSIHETQYGYNMEITVPQPYAKTFFDNNSATIENLYNNFITPATATKIQVSPTDNSLRVVTLNAKTRVDEDTVVSVKLSADIKRSSVIPKKYIRSDANGTYIYVLGRQKITKSISYPVAIKQYFTAATENNEYISAAENLNGIQILTTTNKRISDGRRVLINNG